MKRTLKTGPHRSPLGDAHLRVPQACLFGSGVEVWGASPWALGGLRTCSRPAETEGLPCGGLLTLLGSARSFMTPSHAVKASKQRPFNLGPSSLKNTGNCF